MTGTILAVDPGVSGGMATHHPEKGVKLQKFTTESEFIDFVKNIKGEVRAVVEHVPKYIGNQMMASHSFTLGYNVGFEIGVLKALGITVDLVRPQKGQGWMKIPGIGGKKGPARKRMLRDHAKELYPKEKVTLANADALLILDYYLKGSSR